MLALCLALSALQGDAPEALRQRIAELEQRLGEQQKLIDQLLQRLPPDDPIRETLALEGHPCARHLRALWARQMQYAVQFGGRMKMLPLETGPAFWLKLTQTAPPLVGEKERSLLSCPTTPAAVYRGPAQPVPRVPGGDPVGCCEPDGHRDRSIVVLFKSGDVKLVRPRDPLYAEALAKTAGDPEREAARIARLPSTALKTICTAEADFRANDRDGNGVQDFWVADVSGLYRVQPRPGFPLKLIETAVAEADAAPLKDDALLSPAVSEPRPYAGYLFRALRGYGDRRHTSAFGFAAYPAEYPKSGKLTMIVNETNTLYGRDLGGKAPETWPSAEELARDWHKLD